MGELLLLGIRHLNFPKNSITNTTIPASKVHTQKHFYTTGDHCRDLWLILGPWDRPVCCFSSIHASRALPIIIYITWHIYYLPTGWKLLPCKYGPSSPTPSLECS